MHTHTRKHMFYLYHSHSHFLTLTFTQSLTLVLTHTQSLFANCVLLRNDIHWPHANCLVAMEAQLRIKVKHMA